MIPSISRGDDPGGLTRYLAGKGKANEHRDQRVVGGSLGLEGPMDRDMVRMVAGGLQAPQWAHPDVHPKGGQVWHCSLSLSSAEGVLSDAKWKAIASDFMVGMGFDDPNLAPARWVAVRHGLSVNGNDHLHVAASVIREDGRVVKTWRDYPKAQAVCADLEAKHGLVVLESRHQGRGSRGLSAGELRRQREAGPGAPAERHSIEQTVRAAATASTTEAEFVRRLRGAGLQARAVELVNRKPVPLTPGGKASGYSVARVGSDAWYRGGSLSRDLTLPRLRAGWAGDGAGARETWLGSGAPGREAGVVQLTPVTYRKATAELRGLERQLVGGMSLAQVAEASHAVAGALAAAATRPEYTRGEVPKAARAAAKLTGSRAAPKPPKRLALSAGLLFMQAADPGSTTAQAVMLRQLMATFRAVQDANRATARASNRKGSKGMAEDGMDDMVDGLSTVVVTVAARALEKHAIGREERAEQDGRRRPKVTAEGKTAEGEATDAAEVKGGGVAVAERTDPKDRAPGDWKTGGDPVTPAQRSTLVNRGVDPADVDKLTKASASERIAGKDRIATVTKLPTAPPVVDKHTRGRRR